jgi:tetratricopeptide (TPR) repeat protein
MAAVLLAAFWTFRGALGNPFHFDDSLFLENPDVTSPGDLGGILRASQIRPLTYLSFFLNYRLGGRNPFGYHLVNLVLHLLNTLGVYLFARLLSRSALERRGEQLGRWFAPASAALFALHPIQNEPVNYVYQRSTMVAALFALASLALYLASERHRRPAALLGLSVLAGLLAVGGKEAAATVPAVVILHLALFSRDRQDLASRIRRAGAFVAAFAALVISAGLWTLYLLQRSGERTAGIGASAVGPLDYLVGEVQVVPVYLRLILWPSGLSVDPDPVIAPALSLRFALSLALVLALVGAALLLRRASPTAAFLIVSFLVLLAPTSSLIPSADWMFEHRLYLPLVAAAPLGALGAGRLARLLARRERRDAVALALVVALAAAAAAGAHARTFVWGDNVRLWSDASSKAPSKPRPHYNLGVAYLRTDRDKARQEFQKAVALRPDHAPSLYNLGWLEQTAGRYDVARRWFEGALAADPRFWQALHNLGNLDVVDNRLDGAAARFEAAARIRPDYWPAYLSLATLELRRGDSFAARRSLERLRELRPDLLEARYLLAYALVESGERKRAEEELRMLGWKDREGRYRERIEELRRRVTTP